MRTIEVNGVIGYEYPYSKMSSEIALANGDDITFIINSPGGVVTEGFAMVSAMRAYKSKYPKAKIITELRGLAGSMAPVVAGSEYVDIRRAEDNASFMIHNPFVVAIGDYDDLRKASENMEQLSMLYARSLARKNTAGKTEKEIRSMMDDETWLYGEKIKAMGFVDEIIPAGDGAEDESTALAYAKAEFSRACDLIRSKKEEPDAQAVAMADVIMKSLPGKSGSEDNQNVPAGEGEDAVYKTVAEFKTAQADLYKEVADSAVAAERERVRALSDLKAKASKVGAAVELIDTAIAEGKSAEEIAVNVTSLVLAAADSPGPLHASGSVEPTDDYVPISIIH